MTDEATRAVAWAIAESWWRKTHRRAAGSTPEADSSTEYADNFWQGFVDEARAAIAAFRPHTVPLSHPVASDRFA